MSSPPLTSTARVFVLVSITALVAMLACLASIFMLVRLNAIASTNRANTNATLDIVDFLEECTVPPEERDDLITMDGCYQRGQDRINAAVQEVIASNDVSDARVIELLCLLAADEQLLTPPSPCLEPQP